MKSTHLFQIHGTKNTMAQKINSICRRIAIATCFVVGMQPMQAQVTIPSDDDAMVIPKKFSATGKPQLIFPQANGQLQIYDENLNLIKEVASPARGPLNKKIIEERSILPDEYTDKVVNDQDTWTVETLNEAIIEAQSRGLEVHISKGDVHIFQPQIAPGHYGEYQQLTYTESTKEMRTQLIMRQPAYGDWAIVEEIEKETYTHIDNLHIYNYDEELPKEGVDINLTQTLFNTDDKYECFIPVYSYMAKADTNVVERSPYDESPIKREVHFYQEQTATNICSAESGEILYSLPICPTSIIQLGGKYYITNANDKYPDEDCVFYQIDWFTNSIKEVHTNAVRMYPGMVHRSENVVIETSEEMAQAPKKVVITDMNGQLMSIQNIPAGQTTTLVNTARLKEGLYNFTVKTEGKVIENGKIIIR